ncbi:MAG TPA: hypothetical protein VHE99_11820 [Gammaproteobacteria bacterium]|nr:hypothetical protein [Gammaproteobacteria bacterium]
MTDEKKNNSFVTEIRDQKKRGIPSFNQTIAGIFLTNPEWVITHPILLCSSFLPVTLPETELQSAVYALILLLVGFTLEGEVSGFVSAQILRQVLQKDEKLLFERARKVIDECEKQINLFLKGQLPQQFAEDEFKATKSFKHIRSVVNYLQRLWFAMEKISSHLTNDPIWLDYINLFLKRIDEVGQLTQGVSVYSSPIEEQQMQEPQGYARFPFGSAPSEEKKNKFRIFAEVELAASDVSKKTPG